MASALSLPAASALETAQIDAESIAQASQAAQAHAESIAKESQAAQVDAESIAKAFQAAQIHAKSIAKASRAAQIHATSIAKAAEVAHIHARNITEALTVSEIRYRRLFESARDGVLILDSETGRITEANPFIAELLGYPQDDLHGKELWEIGLLRDKVSSQEAFQHLLQDGDIRYENLPLETRRGERREVEFVSNLYREDGYTFIQCNIRDITDRKVVARELATVATKNNRIAETLQNSMLQEAPEGKYSGLDVKTLYLAAKEESSVGGDFFDTFALSRNKIALVVGDVMGKGLSAAAQTVEVKYALRAFLHTYTVPEIALAYLNDFICKTHHLDSEPTETFIILALIVVDTDTGEAVFSTAGAEPSLILRVTGGTDQLRITGMPLGIQQGTKYTSKVMQLEPGDTVLMATDGITEVRCGNKFLGSDGLAALAEKIGPSVGLDELIESLSSKAREFGGGAFRDDVCLLLARRHELAINPGTDEPAG